MFGAGSAIRASTGAGMTRPLTVLPDDLGRQYQCVTRRHDRVRCDNVPTETGIRHPVHRIEPERRIELLTYSLRSNLPSTAVLTAENRMIPTTAEDRCAGSYLLYFAADSVPQTVHKRLCHRRR